MKKIYHLIILICAVTVASAQTNISCTNPVAEKVMRGNYNPDDFKPSVIISSPKQMVAGINNEVRPDSAKSYLVQLERFINRNTASDTVSTTKGIGAARRWVYSYFQKVSAANENRLIPSYLSFRQTVCTKEIECRNIFAVLPGSDTGNHAVIIIEGHLDSRCEDVCDTACVALGMEDNGSGTSLVLELARVMSKYSFKNTIVFIATIGEEQGLLGAGAFAIYCKQNNINVKAVLNNDIVGGIICGETSSPPSCPYENHIDSANVRLFSSGKNLSRNKGLVRYIKLQYADELNSVVAVPMKINIMNAEDRTGRGGDHIPFREQGFAAMRFTSANEHGDASPDQDYTDRQHSTRDILGVDTTGDLIIDSFFVDFNYLCRNAVINGVSAAMLAQGVRIPSISLVNDASGIKVNIHSDALYKKYKVGVRTKFNDFDALYEVNNDTTLQLSNIKKDTTYFVSAAAVDDNGTESLFSEEKMAKSVLGTGVENNMKGELPIELLPAFPNPFDETTTITVVVHHLFSSKDNFINITDVQGKLLKQIPLELKQGLNEVVYEHGYHVTGVYYYSLVLDGKIVSTKKMVFVN